MSLATTLHHRPHLSTKSQIQHWTKTLPQPNKQALLEGYISIRVGTSKVKAASKIRWFRLTPTEVLLKRKNGEITRRFGLENIYECDPWPKDRSCFTILVRFPNVAKSVVLLIELASSDDVPVWVTTIRNEIEAARKEGRISSNKAVENSPKIKKSRVVEDDSPEEKQRKRRNSDPETPTLERFGGPPAPTAERTLKKSGMGAGSRAPADDDSFDMLARRQSTTAALSQSGTGNSLSFENEQNRAVLSKKKNKEKLKQVDKAAADNIKGHSVYFNGINPQEKISVLKEYGVVTCGLIVFYQELKIQPGQVELNADQIDEAIQIGRIRGESQIQEKASRVYGNGNVNAVLGMGYTVALNQAGVVIMLYGTACGVSASRDVAL
eukprot:TRINITY_DN22907_c0_g1_i1.p1 TRINITY_DN22907_c0_g1~~TRINITY_DN22907_c0_g1_i1.p1  ORF type:complete len:388 (-),score=98.37 TRINITY_DN22907_c0_g1_i1:37-1179(-)